MKKRFLLSIALILVTVVAMGQTHVRISTFDLKDAGSNSLILGANIANANSVAIGGQATAAALDFIYLAGTDLTNTVGEPNKVTLVPTFNGNGISIVDPLPADFSEPFTLKVENATIYSLYNVNPRQLTPIELPATMDLTTPFSSATEGWAQARLDQKKPTINGAGTDAIGFAAAGVFMLLSFSNTPDVLSFKIASAATNNGNVLDVYESIDGITWNTPIATYSDASSTIPVVTSVPETPKSINLNSATRFVKFNLQARSSGNFYLFNISATAATGTGISNASVADTKVFVQNGLLNILSNEIITGLEIFSFNGQLLAKTGNPANQVNIADLPAGCYIAKLKNATGQTAICRFVK